MKLVKIIAIQGTLEVLTGLHIGAGDSEMHIGGTDSPVIKNPHTNLPYVPGSSIKGKMRSLLEWRYGLVGFNNGKPFGHKNLKPLAGKPEHMGALNLLKMFGVSGGDQPNAQEAETLGIGLTRLAFRDCELMDEWVRDKRERILLVTETKFENTINRIAGTAEHPRNFERVPAGALFNFAVTLKVLDSDDENALLTMLLTGLKLIELDALGGSGSRGYGRVKFVVPEHQTQLDQIDPFTDKPNQAA